MGFTGPQGKLGLAGPRGVMGTAGPPGPEGPEGPRGVNIIGKYEGDFLKWNESKRDWDIDNKNVKIGRNSGYMSNNTGSVCIGEMAGKTFQSNNCIAIGSKAAETTQGEFSIAIGELAGNSIQNSKSVAIGYRAGFQKQGNNSVAIGYSAGLYSLGNNCIAIGNLINTVKETKRRSCAINNSICLNASETPMKIQKQSSFYVNPVASVKDTTGYLPLFYNPETKEIVFKEME